MPAASSTKAFHYKHTHSTCLSQTFQAPYRVHCFMSYDSWFRCKQLIPVIPFGLPPPNYLARWPSLPEGFEHTRVSHPSHAFLLMPH